MRARFPGKWYASLADALLNLSDIPYWGPRGHPVPWGKPTSSATIAYFNQSFHQVQAKQQSLVVSSENFAIAPFVPGALELLRSCFRPYPTVSVVAIFRARSAMLQSWYTQVMGRRTTSVLDGTFGYWRSSGLSEEMGHSNIESMHAAMDSERWFPTDVLLPSEWLFELFSSQDALNRSLLSHSTVYDAYARVFGRENLHLIALDRKEAVRRDVLHVLLCDIMQLPQCRHARDSSLQAINPSLTTMIKANHQNMAPSLPRQLMFQAAAIAQRQLSATGCRARLQSYQIIPKNSSLEVYMQYMLRTKRLPLRCSHLATINTAFDRLDHDLVEAYSDRFVGGAPYLAGSKAKEWCELAAIEFSAKFVNVTQCLPPGDDWMQREWSRVPKVEQATRNYPAWFPNVFNEYE